ncbi:MAG: DUF5709 domain-containing protein [Bifidobacteriaceae bacterium]|jgi:hypothetical protein|nr:DUF5709 domain-containing protein [Bifidobacteriaceae bacterium]
MDRFTDAPEDPPFDLYQDTPEDLLTPGDLDPLDTDYDPPDREPVAAKRLWEEGDHETLDERLADEEPEVWDIDAELVDTRRTGRLEAVESGRVADVFAQDDGLDGLGASAEEAAVHYES